MFHLIGRIHLPTAETLERERHTRTARYTIKRTCFLKCAVLPTDYVDYADYTDYGLVLSTMFM